MGDFKSKVFTNWFALIKPVPTNGHSACFTIFIFFINSYSNNFLSFSITMISNTIFCSVIISITFANHFLCFIAKNISNQLLGCFQSRQFIKRNNRSFPIFIIRRLSKRIKTHITSGMFI